MIERALHEIKQTVINLRNQISAIIKAPDIDLACDRLNRFLDNKQQFGNSVTMQYLIKRLICDFENLTMYLQYPKGLLPRTIGVCEGMNQQLKARTRSMCSFQFIKSAEDYLNLWCLKRRFQKFTDCKKPHQKLNGKTPLELAGCNIKNLDYLCL